MVTPWMYSISSLDRSYFKTRCPQVKEIKNFNLESMMGFWYVVQYYASSEELPEYACMRSYFTFDDNNRHNNEKLVTMNFSYIYAEDPYREQLIGNITWRIPNFNIPAHWVHTEYIYEGVYNTYVIDTDYESWSLIMHCAEKSKSPRYLSALLLSREPSVATNVASFLRDKLPQYDIDLSFMFDIRQDEDMCESVKNVSDPISFSFNSQINRKRKISIIPNK
ncbi:uncharacterized protein LOC129605384 [Condylostylus longicornis]|uniref:uncharacterized protein LOC129605384 n=1 Tax=Condylostylus longicornis TaxID=2530218 RepID=UPI00244DC59A|nr:uncharacterized protein LOC129605384 [Condylostylus longicornis]